MRARNRIYCSSVYRRGFSLLELSMVLVISGLMVSFVLQANQSTAPQNDCYVVTKAQLNTIRASVERFARKNDRLPVPAARNVGVEDIKYGREAVTGTAAVVEASANLDLYGTGATAVSYGALPFQALGLSPSFGSDCWGNKFSYAVTTALTNSTGFKDSTVVGNIAVKSSLTITTNAKGAYAVISHGEDGIGAVKTNFSAANPAHAWCTTGTALKHLNCNIAGAVADAVFNNGKDAGANYFDDVVVAGGKPQVLSSGTVAYCWGENLAGELGNGTTTASTVPVPVMMPSGVNYFVQAVAGQDHVCAIGDDAKTYCWGDNSKGQLGDGTTTNSLTPKPLSGYNFVELASGSQAFHTCGLTAAGVAYCWGLDDAGQLGVSPVADTHTPTIVNTAQRFIHIYASNGNSCGIIANGDAYCWGTRYYGQVGDGVGSGWAWVPTKVLGGYKFRTLAVGQANVCGIARDGINTYCWGTGGGVGDDNPSPAFAQATPVGVTTNGTVAFTKIAGGGAHMCGITATGAAYCWGFGGRGQLGYGWVTDYNHPTPVFGTLVFTDISAGYHASCGLTTDGKEYCWGGNGWYNLGNGNNSDQLTPVQVTGTGVSPLVFGHLTTGTQFSCGYIPTPPASWGENSTGAVGDGTTITRTAPVYVKMPSGISGFASVAGASCPECSWSRAKCGLTFDGKAYCWGDATYQQIGNGSTSGMVKQPTAVTMPGVTFKSIVVGTQTVAAIGSDNKPYQWGMWADGTIKAVPTWMPVPSPGGTVLDIKLWGASGIVLGSDNQAYSWQVGGHENSLYQVPLTGTGLTSVKAVGGGYGGGIGINLCIIGNDDQIYCNGWSGNPYGAVGDGSTSGGGSALLVAVTKPSDPPLSDATFHYFKTLSTGASSSVPLACALADNNQIYCWGHGGGGMIGNGSNTTVYVPTKVSLPAGSGATGWQSVLVDKSYVVGVADNGLTYYWGNIGDGTGYHNLPVPIPLPPGASGYSSVNKGAIGLVQ